MCEICFTAKDDGKLTVKVNMWDCEASFDAPEEEDALPEMIADAMRRIEMQKLKNMLIGFVVDGGE